MSNINNPFFSIITCTYNRGYLIERAIQSVLNQNFVDWELLIIDDGSEDETNEIVKKYISLDKRIKYYYQIHKGLSESRNHGVIKASGNYITFLDSDDEYLQNHLKYRYDLIIKSKNLEFVLGGVSIVGNPFVPDKNDKKKLIHLSKCVLGGTFFIKKDIFNRIGLFPILDYGDDANFYEMAQNNGVQIKRIKYETYKYYRDQPDSMCNKLKNMYE